MKKFLIFILILIVNIYAKNTGLIKGSVTDATTGEPLIGANIVLIGEKMGAATDLEGNYLIENVTIGSHDVKVSMMGYRSIVNNRVIVKPGRPTVLNFELNEDVSTTDAVVVKPSYFPKTKDAAVSSKNMDYEEIAIQPGGSFDIQRSIQAMPSVVSSADTDNEIIVRGGNYGENLFVLDGIEIPNPNHFGWMGSGGGAISAIYMDFVEEVDFIAGAFPAKYGGKASSVLDIDLREGLRDRFHFKFDLGMSGAGGNIEGPIFDKKGSYMLAYHRSFLDLIASTWGMTAIPQYWNSQGKLNYEFNPKLKLNCFGMYGKDWIEIDARDGDYGDADINWSVDSRTEQYTAGANLKKITDIGYGKLTAYTTVHMWNEETTDTTLTDVFYSNKTREGTFALKADISIIPFEDNEFSAGLYSKYNIFNYDYFDDPDTLYIYEPGTDSIIASTGYTYGLDTTSESSTYKLGGYVQYRHNFGPLFYTNLGARVDYMDYHQKLYVSPRLSLTYKLTTDTDISLAYGRHYQQADWYMLALNGKDRPLDYYYNDQIVLGLDHLFAEDIRGTVEGYYKKYQDVPIEKSSTTPDPYDEELVYVNALEGYATGVEFFLQKKVKENFWGTLSYSYSIAKNQDPRKDFCENNEDCIYDEYPKSFDYRHVTTGVLGYREEFKEHKWYNEIKENWWWETISWIPGMPSDESEYSLRFRYLGGRPYTQPQYHDSLRTWSVEPDQQYNQERMRPYSSLDLHVQSRWYSGNVTIFTYLELDNALNRKNIWEYVRNSDGTTDIVYQRGRMFVGGVIVEF